MAELDDGRWFGEMAIITGEPRSATARAEVDTELLVLTRASFHVLLARMPVLGVRLSEELSRRLRARLVASSRDDSHRVIVLDGIDGATHRGARASDRAPGRADRLDGLRPYCDLRPAGPPPTCRGVPAPRWAAIDDCDRRRRSYYSALPRAPTCQLRSAPLRARPSMTPDSTPDAPVPAQRRSAYCASPSRPLRQRLRRRRVGLVVRAGGAGGLTRVAHVRAFRRVELAVDLVDSPAVTSIVATVVTLGGRGGRIDRLHERVERERRTLLILVSVFGSPVPRLRGRTMRTQLANRTDCERLDLPLWILATDVVVQRHLL